jgi:hypothetical protein
VDDEEERDGWDEAGDAIDESIIGDLTGEAAKRAADEERAAADAAVGVYREPIYGEEETDNLLGDSEGSRVARGPGFLDAEYEALSNLTRMAGGMLTPEEEQRRQQFSDQAWASQRGGRGAAVQQAQMRGGGAAAAEVAGLQGAADDQWLRGDLQAGFAASDDAIKRQALDELGRFQGSSRRQGFDEQMGQASAIDRFRENNTAHTQDTRARNADAFNQRMRDTADASMGRAQRAEQQGQQSRNSGRSTAAALGTAAASSSDDDGGRDYRYGSEYG